MIPDEILYEQIRQGDMDAFDRLYSRYERMLFLFLLRYVGRREDAEELFHEAFLRVLDSKEVRFEEGSFRSWVFRIARNLSLNFLRAEKRKNLFQEKWKQETQGIVKNRIDPVETQEMAKALEDAVLQLPISLAEVYRLRVAGMAYEEISHILDIPLGTVKSRMHHLVQRLREELHIWITP